MSDRPPLPEAWLAGFEAKVLKAVREACMAVEFAEQTQESLEFGAFDPATDSELDSAESALITAGSLIEEASEMLALVRRSAAKTESGVQG